MSSFFTLPASQKKRKRPESAVTFSSSAQRGRGRDDDSISGSDVSDDDAAPALEDDSGTDDEDQGYENEDPSAKRVRLAEQYIANTQREVLEDVGFDAAEVDRENLSRRMGERLKEDTAESKGKLYRHIADGLHWRGADKTICRPHGMQKTMTGIAIYGEYVYAVNKNFQLVKLELPDHKAIAKRQRISKQPTLVARARGHSKQIEQHTQSILCIAVSPDGKFIATGGLDKKLVIWEAASLKPLKVFTQHRDAVTALAFRRGTNQLYSSSKDRTVKIWSLNELAYVETLFGHQDEVVDVDALAQETCITVGARDRTARLWKVVEESQLVFRGGGMSGSAKAIEALKRAYANGSENDGQPSTGYSEGSIDRVAMIDDETFVTGSDNGSLSLWNTHKKKATFVLPLAHGLDPAVPLDQASAEEHPDGTVDEQSRGGRQARWITALRAIPFSDVLISGSWDGYVRAWRISADKRRIEPLGAVGVQVEDLDVLLQDEGLSSTSLSDGAFAAMRAGVETQGLIHGIVNDLAIVDRGERGKDGVLIAAAVGKEHRLGRWKDMDDGKNCVALFRVPLKTATNGYGDEAMLEGNGAANGDKFEGFE